ncbi:MAG: gluconate 2-dehydrogenase subunit 3 family protein [Siphonobacter sp.]
MKRRIVLRNLAAAAGGMMVLPSWANGWNQETLAQARFLTTPQEEILAEITEVIIPATDTPGAKSLGVAVYIQKIVKDCMDTKSQESLTNGLALAEKAAQQSYGKTYTSLSGDQKMEILKQMSQSADQAARDFAALVKSLTIRGYTTSEYYMTNVSHYQLVPGHYFGCVPVGK